MSKFKQTVARSLPSSKPILTTEQLENKKIRQQKHIRDNYIQKQALAEAKAKELEDKNFIW